MLADIVTFEPMTRVEGNCKLDIVKGESGLDVQWIYTENGIDVPKKRLQLQFDQW